MKSHYREKIYECGRYIEAHIYPVYRKAGIRRKKAKPSRKCQEKLNQIHAETKCIMIVHRNFTSDDMRLDLTYDNSHLPENDEAAAKEVRNFLRRVRRYRNSKGLPEVKYIYVTEKGSRKGRYHHHLIISGGLMPSELAKLWGRGYIRTDSLQFNENGVADLVRYMLKRSVEPQKRKWIPSKNLVKPEVIQQDNRLTARQVKELAKDTENNREYEKYYAGLYFSGAKVIYNEINGGVYIYARFYKEEEKYCRNINRVKRRSK